MGYNQMNYAVSVICPSCSMMSAFRNGGSSTICNHCGTNLDRQIYEKVREMDQRQNTGYNNYYNPSYKTHLYDNPNVSQKGTECSKKKTKKEKSKLNKQNKNKNLLLL